MTVREAVRKLLADRWYLAFIHGTEREFRHLDKKTKIIVGGMMDEELPEDNKIQIYSLAQWQA